MSLECNNEKNWDFHFMSLLLIGFPQQLILLTFIIYNHPMKEKQQQNCSFLTYHW